VLVVSSVSYWASRWVIGAVCGRVVGCWRDIFGKRFDVVVWVWIGEKVWGKLSIVDVRAGGIERFVGVVSRRSFVGVVSGKEFRGRKKGLAVHEGVCGKVVVVVVRVEGVGRFVGAFSKLSKRLFIVVVSGEAFSGREEEGCVVCLENDDVR
jgi:hypothetical protein